MQRRMGEKEKGERGRGSRDVDERWREENRHEEREISGEDVWAWVKVACQKA